MSIFIPAFTGGVREMTRLGRLAHLHGNYTASLHFLMQPLLLHHIPLWLLSYYHSYQACFFIFSPLEDFLTYMIPHLDCPPPQTEPPLASLNQRACCCNSVLTHVSWLCVWIPFVSSPLWGPLPCGWKSLWALCSSRGVSPSPTPPPLPLFYWVLLRNANLLTSFPFNNCSMAPSFKTGAELLPFDYNFNYNQF